MMCLVLLGGVWEPIVLGRRLPGGGTSMMEPENVKNRGLSRVSDGKVKDDWATLGPRVRWTDLEEGSISSCGSSRWVARL